MDRNEFYNLSEKDFVSFMIKIFSQKPLFSSDLIKLISKEYSIINDREYNKILDSIEFGLKCADS